MLRLDVRTAVLTGLVVCEENAACFCVWLHGGLMSFVEVISMLPDWKNRKDVENRDYH